jgi:23S rRNA (adenine2503-C2)-methyltransferase
LCASKEKLNPREYRVMIEPLVHWWDLLHDSRNLISAKSKWKILREGVGLQAVLSNHRFATSWSVLAEYGEYSRGAIKCLIRSIEFGDECEMVVLFPRSGKRATVCVSSQIGCAVGCRFCSTGMMGFRRNLSYYEILEQVYLARCVAIRFGRSLRNVVFMGMGEPMHNCEAVWESLNGMIGDTGFGLSPRAITVSTAIGGGMLIETAKKFPNIRIALSLHAADGDVRRDLVPKSPSEMERMKEVIRTINRIQSGDPLWLEITMLKGVNDRPSDVAALVEFSRDLNVQINLIPYNPIRRNENSDDTKTLPLMCYGSELQSTELIKVYAIAQYLRDKGLVVRVRNSFGDQDNAACGQLALSHSHAINTAAEIINLKAEI